jgi:hypothetical protein
MKAYKFIFFVGFLNLTIPFLGIPFLYKNYVLLALAIVTIAYGLILRAVEQEKKFAREQRIQSEVSSPKTIEDVVEMSEVAEPVVVADVVVKKRGRRPKAVASQEIYE